METQWQRPVAKVLSRPDLVLEILRQLPTAERASAATVCQIFAAASRDAALWRAGLPKWWAAALEDELGRDPRAWRNSALALHLHFPAALTLEPLKMARRAASEPEEDSERDEDALRDEKTSRILESVWRLASVSPSAWWHDLILSKTLHEFELEREAGDGTPRQPLPRPSAETQEHAEEDPSGPVPRSGGTTPYHWHGMVHFHLARATWRRGQWRRALRHFQVAVATCPRESEVLAGLGVFLCSCPVPGGASGCNLLDVGSGATEAGKQQEENESQHREKQQTLSRRYDLVTARKSIELALQCENGLGWVFSEVGEERLALVMSQLEGEDGFSPATAKTSDTDWQDDLIDTKQRNHGDDNARHGTAVVLGSDWLPVRWETNRPPWERQLIRKFNLERDIHFQRSSGSTPGAASPSQAAENEASQKAPSARNGRNHLLCGAPGLPRLDETTALEAVADGAGQHVGMMTPQFAAAAAGHGAFGPDIARQLVGRSWVRVDQYDVIEALSVACCVFEVAGEQTGLSSSIGDLSIALRCSGDTSWALRAAQKALALMARQRQCQHEQQQRQQQRQGTGDDANSEEDDDSNNDAAPAATAGDTAAGDDGLNGSNSTALSLQFACAVVYAERAHQAHNTLMLLSRDYPAAICLEAADLSPCLEDTAQLRQQYQEQHAEGQRHMAALLRHFSAEACGTLLRAASDGHSDSGGNAVVATAPAPAAVARAAATEQQERELNWQDSEVLQDPTIHGGRAMLWTERHRSSLAQMNHYFAQAMQTSKQLSAPGGDVEGDVEGEDNDDAWLHIAPGLGVEAGEGADQVSVGKNERERAVVCEWIHSLCDAGQIADAKRKLKDLWALLEGPLKKAHQVLVAHEDPDGPQTIANSAGAALQQTATAEMTTAGDPVMPVPKTQDPAQAVGGQNSSQCNASGSGSGSGSDTGSGSDNNNRVDAAHTRWRGIDRDTLELLEEEMSYLLLKAKLDEATPWCLSIMMTASDVDGSGAVQEPKRPSSSVAAAEGYERAVNLAKRIAQRGPMIQCLKRPIPPGCFDYIRGRLRPVMHASNSKPGTNPSVLATGDDLGDVLETCLFRARIGPQARAFRELSRSHLSLYNPTAAMASVQQCLQLVGPPLELMMADSSHRSTDELTGEKQSLVQLGPPMEMTTMASHGLTSIFEDTDKRTREQPGGKLALNSIGMDMRVLGPGSTISVALEDNDEDACARRQQLFDVCAGAIAESHTLAAQLSQRSCDYEVCERHCKAALEIAPRLPGRNRRWVEMLAIGTRGDSALTRGDWNAALAAYHSALEIATSIGECLAAAAAELQLAEVERRRENIANINACRVRAKVSGKNAARSGTGALRTVAAALRTSASASIMAKQYETARRQLQACFQLILKESPPWWSGQSSAWHVLGTLCAATGERTAAVSHWRRGLVLAIRASDPMLTAIHTRDVLKYTTNRASTGTIRLSPVEREQLLASGLAAAKKVSDPALIKTFTELERGLSD